VKSHEGPTSQEWIRSKPLDDGRLRNSDGWQVLELLGLGLGGDIQRAAQLPVAKSALPAG